MKISLFSQSLRSLPIRDAVLATAEAGFDAIEISCWTREPAGHAHLSLEEARSHSVDITALVSSHGLAVSALSTYVDLTTGPTLESNIRALHEAIRVARAYGTDTVKIMPGPPSARAARLTHWRNWRAAIAPCIAVARTEGVKLAVETHLRMLSDTTESTLRLLEGLDPKVVGVNLDFCNVHIGGDDAVKSIDRLAGRLFFTHVKNVTKQAAELTWVPLSEGELDYNPIVSRLVQVGYDGYMSIECLYERPGPELLRLVKEDCDHLRRLLREV